MLLALAGVLTDGSGGLTARAGATGIAVSFVVGEEKGWLKQIERLTKIPLTPAPLPPNFDELRAKLPKPAPSKAPPGRGSGRRDAPRSDEPKRHFPRRPGGVGAHKSAVRRTGGR